MEEDGAQKLPVPGGTRQWDLHTRRTGSLSAIATSTPPRSRRTCVPPPGHACHRFGVCILVRLELGFGTMSWIRTSISSAAATRHAANKFTTERLAFLHTTLRAARRQALSLPLTGSGGPGRPARVTSDPLAGTGDADKALHARRVQLGMVAGQTSSEESDDASEDGDDESHVHTLGLVRDGQARYAHTGSRGAASGRAQGLRLSRPAVVMDTGSCVMRAGIGSEPVPSVLVRMGDGAHVGKRPWQTAANYVWRQGIETCTKSCSSSLVCVYSTRGLGSAGCACHA